MNSMETSQIGRLHDRVAVVRMVQTRLSLARHFSFVPK